MTVHFPEELRYLLSQLIFSVDLLLILRITGSCDGTNYIDPLEAVTHIAEDVVGARKQNPITADGLPKIGMHTV